MVHQQSFLTTAIAFCCMASTTIRQGPREFLAVECPHIATLEHNPNIVGGVTSDTLYQIAWLRSKTNACLTDLLQAAKNGPIDMEIETSNKNGEIDGIEEEEEEA